MVAPNALLLALAIAVVNAQSSAKYFFTFGDSYSQTGFNITGTKPSASQPLGNPAYPGFTTSGGANWIGDYVTQLNSSLIYSYNFAYGGATTDANLVKPFDPSVLSLVDQVNIFSSNLAAKPSYAPWTSANTLVGVWMGINDIGNSYYLANYNTLVNQILGRYFDQVQILYNAGVRKFLFLSVPPINKTPVQLMQSSSSQQQEAAAITTYNNLIVSKAKAFKSANPGVRTYYLDTSTPFNTAIANPTAYGAPDATCFDASGTKCLWWNNYHPGQAIQELVAQAVAKLLGAW